MHRDMSPVRDAAHSGGLWRRMVTGGFAEHTAPAAETDATAQMLLKKINGNQNTGV